VTSIAAVDSVFERWMFEPLRLPIGVPERKFDAKKLKLKKATRVRLRGASESRETQAVRYRASVRHRLAGEWVAAGQVVPICY
jgi:hypothetical protein